MLQTYAHSNTLGLESDTARVQVAVDILSRVPCSKNHRRSKELATIGTYAADASALYEQFLHTCLKMHLASALKDSVAHILYYPRQLVGTKVRVRIGKNSGARTELAECIQHPLDASALFASRVELAVGVCTCSTLAEAIVRFGVHRMRTAYIGNVYLAGTHVLSALHHNGTQPLFNEFEGSKESCRACAHHNDTLCPAYFRVLLFHILVVLGLFVHIYPYGKIDIYCTLTRIDAATQHTHAVY